ncbi:MAG: flavin reductase family protein [Methylophilaceae bacterium]|uniref:flavin reductase family protein n=1 Tax=Methylovorus sp. MM2 TaxID=1848038 RepID=UPI0007E24BC7|nr:flavin reductase family protein [Methylovorus sp. MM2]OAM51162.1 flavin reductase [Methylovorus sp. MM2]
MKPIQLKHAYRLINHGPVVLLSAEHAGMRDIMAVAWNMPLDFEPARLLVVLDKTSNTRKLVEGSGTFGISIPTRSQVNTIMSVGSISASELPSKDKFLHWNLATTPATHIQAPLLNESVGWLECKVINEPHNQSTYDLFIAEIVAAYADERVFSNGRWHFDDHEEMRTVHYTSGGSFFTTGSSFHIDKKTV